MDIWRLATCGHGLHRSSTNMNTNYNDNVYGAVNNSIFQFSSCLLDPSPELCIILGQTKTHHHPFMSSICILHKCFPVTSHQPSPIYNTLIQSASQFCPACPNHPKLQALGHCIPPPRHVLPVSHYGSRSVTRSVIRIAAKI